MLFGRLEEFPKYRIYTNGDIYREWKNKDVLMKHCLGKTGYCHVNLRNGVKLKKIRIHRLLAILFIPCNSEFKDTEVDHINRVKTDNRLDNLRWMDRTGQNLNKDLKDNNTGYLFITKQKSKTCKSGFSFRCNIKRNKSIFNN